MQNVGLASMDHELQRILSHHFLLRYQGAFEKLGICSTLTFKYAKVLPHCSSVLEWRKMHRLMWILRVGGDIMDRWACPTTKSEWWPKEENWVLHHSGTCRVHVSSVSRPISMVPEDGPDIFYV
jgi:hypothetical protein